MKRLYPIILEAYQIWDAGTVKEPTHTRLIKSDEQYDSFIRFHSDPKNGQYEIMKRSAKWKELKGYVWIAKVYHVIPKWLVFFIGAAVMFLLTNYKTLEVIFSKLLQK